MYIYETTISLTVKTYSENVNTFGSLCLVLDETVLAFKYTSVTVTVNKKKLKITTTKCNLLKI